MGIEKLGDKYFVTSRPVKELSVIEGKTQTLTNITATNYDLSGKTGKLTGPAKITIRAAKLESFSLTFSNAAREKVVVGFDKVANQYFIDRTGSGKVSFEKGFAARHITPRISAKEGADMVLIVDNASIELFADNGLSVMTAIFFPNSPYTDMSIQSQNNFRLNSIEYTPLKSIWK